MSEDDPLRIERARPDAHDRVAELFRASDVPCYCQFFRFSGDHRQWQDRCANHRAENVRQLREDLEGEDYFALIASRQGAVVGWIRLARPDELSKRYENRLYRRLPCLEGERSRVLSVVCFLVHPAERRTGVARALLAAALREARTWGARCVEAFPRGATDVTDEEQWTGPVALYQAAGFELVNDFAPYPVLRLQLDEG